MLHQGGLYIFKTVLKTVDKTVFGYTFNGFVRFLVIQLKES